MIGRVDRLGASRCGVDRKVELGIELGDFVLKNARSAPGIAFDAINCRGKRFGGVRQGVKKPLGVNLLGHGNCFPSEGCGQVGQGLTGLPRHFCREFK